MTEHAVVIAGAGPTGLMLAAELALAKIDVAIVERRPDQELESMRARGIHARTIEVLDQRGVADRFISEGQQFPASMFTGAKFMADLPTRYNFTLGLGQKHFERILADWVDELGVKFYRSRDVTGYAQDERGVDVAVSDGSTLRAKYLVGCDGGRSVIRKTAGIDFPGFDASQSWLIAELEMRDEPKWGFYEDALGKHAIGKADGGLVGLVVMEREIEHSREPSLSDLSEALVAVYGTDFGARNPRWISRFTDATRHATKYRDRRVLLAGDAAHLHPPVGGQGLGMGVQDAVNLGWKLAQVVNGTSPDSLLDAFQAERHPVVERVLRINVAQVTLARPGERMKALRDTMNEILALDEPSRRITAMMSGLDIHYVIPSEVRDPQLGEPHPLLGRRMPDLDLVTASGPLRVFTLLHDARPVLINFDKLGAIAIKPWRDRVQLVDAKYDGAWELPSIGAVAAPSAVLVRPDGYVAWVGEKTQAGLVEALTKWFGPPNR